MLEIQRANQDILDKFANHQKQFEVEKVTRLQPPPVVLSKRRLLVDDIVVELTEIDDVAPRSRKRVVIRSACGTRVGKLL